MSDYTFNWTDPLVRVITAGAFQTGGIYNIVSLGSTDFKLIGAIEYTAGSFTYGLDYVITSVGTTDFTLIGASSNAVGTVFRAIGPGIGTGTALLAQFIATGAGSGTGTATWSAFIVNGNTTNTTATSLQINGKGSISWGENLQQNMLNMLESFASSVAPPNPTVGQLWYNDTTSTISLYTAAGWEQMTTVTAIQGENYSIDSGVANAYVVVKTPPISSYVAGFGGKFKVANTNTGPSTLDAGGGPLPLLNDLGNPLSAGDIQAGSIVSYYFVFADSKFYVTSYTYSETDPRYATPTGNALLNFEVANPIGVNDAVPLGYANTNFANIGGDPLLNFEVANPTDVNDATPLQYLRAFAADPSNFAIVQQTFYSPTVNWNVKLGEACVVILNGNATIAAPTNLFVGAFIMILRQDNIGSRTVTWDPIYQFPGGVKPVLSTAAYAKDVCSFYSDGTYMYGSYLRGVA
jgi:hypothetical protein